MSDKPTPVARQEDLTLRRLLAVSYSGALLYHDDGELQDNRCLPFIDFKRDTPSEIEEKIVSRNLAEQAVARQEEPIPRVVATAPEQIYLQVSDESDDRELEFPGPSEDMTWCQDSIMACEVPYVRADLAFRVMPDALKWMQAP